MYPIITKDKIAEDVALFGFDEDAADAEALRVADGVANIVRQALTQLDTIS